jgi:hypothetical protein
MKSNVSSIVDELKERHKEALALAQKDKKDPRLCDYKC